MCEQLTLIHVTFFVTMKSFENFEKPQKGTCYDYEDLASVAVLYGVN
jgi:hypothetical protein